MDSSALTIEERDAINQGRWFSALSPLLRHDILRCATVKRYDDGELMAARGAPARSWMGCAKGAVRVCSTSLGGKQTTLTYVEPGVWFGDIAMFDGDQRTHDAYAHGPTTVLRVARNDLERLLSEHVELYEAFLQLQARRIRLLFGQLEDLATLPLRARLAKQLCQLQRSYGTPNPQCEEETLITLKLAQEELAQLLGASRQRVNQELKAMEREGAIRVDPAGLIVTNLPLLKRISTPE